MMPKIFQRLKPPLLSYRSIFYLLIIFICVRIYFDWTLLKYPLVVEGKQNVIRFTLENLYYFLIVFLVQGVVISALSRVDLRRVMSTWVWVYPIIAIPPLIDALLLHRVDGYYYCRTFNFVKNISSFFLLGDAPPGISTLVILGIIAVFVYIFLHTHSVMRAALGALALDLLLALISTPDFIFGEARGDYHFDFFLPMFYFFPFVFLFFLAVYIYAKEKIMAAFRNIRFVRSVVFILAVGFGGYFRYALLGEASPLNLFYGMVASFLIWQVSVMINDISDLEIDVQTNKDRPLVTGLVSVQEYQFAAEIFSFVALSFAAVVNMMVFYLIVVQCFLAYVYSVPPVRLRNHFWGNILIGVAVAISFWIGLFSVSPVFSFSEQVLLLTGILFCYGTLITLTKDIKDYEGDKSAGIVNLFTLLGREKGKRVTTVLVLLVLAAPGMIFHNWFFMIIGAVTAYIYQRFENIQAVYIFSMISACMALSAVLNLLK